MKAILKKALNNNRESHKLSLLYLNSILQDYSAAVVSSTLTNVLPLAFLRKVTAPFVSANKVWSLPIPTFTPG